VEWVETTAKTVDDAKELALDRLGVDETDAEFEVLEEPRQGLFGRTRGQARVRGRVRPKAPRPKDDRRDRRRRSKNTKTESEKRGGTKKSGGGGGRDPKRSTNPPKSGDGNRRPRNSSSQGQRGDGRSSGQPKRQDANQRNKQQAQRQQKEDAPMEDVQTCVEEFLTGLTSAFGLEAPVEIVVDEEQIVASIQGKHGLLLGPKARTLDAIQELARVTAKRSTPSSIRIKVDVGGYRETRQAAIKVFANDAAAKALATDAQVVMDPMSSSDRKVVHDALTDVAGVSTRSDGTDPRRYVVVVPEISSGGQPSGQEDGDQAVSADDQTVDDEAVGQTIDDDQSAQ